MEDILGGKNLIAYSSRTYPIFYGIGRLKSSIRIHQLHD